MGNYVFDGIEKKKLTPSRFLYQCENLYLATQVNYINKHYKKFQFLINLAWITKPSHKYGNNRAD